MEVRTEMVAWGRVVPRRTCDTTGGLLVTLLGVSRPVGGSSCYQGADKSLAQPGREEAAPFKSVMRRGMD